MAASPISHVTLLVDRKAVDAVATTLAGIDRGCSLTKAVYVSKSGESNSDTHYALQCVTFANADFEGCLHFLKSEALLPSHGSIHVTGTGCDKFREIIENVLQLKVEFVHEFIAIFRGTHFLLGEIKDKETLFHPKTESDPRLRVEHSQDLKSWVERLKKETSANNSPDPDELLPCIFVIAGSGIAATILQRDGRAKFLGTTMIGGKVLLTLGKAMVGVEDYDQLMDLAKEGEAGAIDNTVSDHYRDDPNSPYGYFPPDQPFFPFGKILDDGKALEDFTQKDRAASVVRMVGQALFSHLQAVSAAAGINRVVYGGNVTRGEPMRTAISDISDAFTPGVFDLNFLRTGTSGAIGCMITSPEAKVSDYLTI